MPPCCQQPRLFKNSLCAAGVQSCLCKQLLLLSNIYFIKVTCNSWGSMETTIERAAQGTTRSQPAWHATEARHSGSREWLEARGSPLCLKASSTHLRLLLLLVHPGCHLLPLLGRHVGSHLLHLRSIHLLSLQCSSECPVSQSWQSLHSCMHSSMTALLRCAQSSRTPMQKCPSAMHMTFGHRWCAGWSGNNSECLRTKIQHCRKMPCRSHRWC